MKLQKKVSISGDWAKKGEDIKDSDIVVMLDAGTTITGDYGDRQVFKIKTRNGEKLLSFNQTSINNLIDAYGEETENWVGKNVKVWIVKASVGGKLKDVVYLSAPDWVMTEDGFAPPANKTIDDSDIPIIEESDIADEDIPF